MYIKAPPQLAKFILGETEQTVAELLESDEGRKIFSDALSRYVLNVALERKGPPLEPFQVDHEL